MKQGITGIRDITECDGNRSLGDKIMMCLRSTNSY
jgi:hypothetical protein